MSFSLQPKKCCKCGVQMSNLNGHLSGHYNEIYCVLDNGNTMVVGICPECFVKEEEFPELHECLVKECGIKGSTKIVSVSGRKTSTEVIKEIQNDNCFKCGEKIGDKWIYTGGRLQHERCG